MTNPGYLAIDGHRMLHSLQEAQTKLNTGSGDLVLDFSAVHRIDPASLRALEELARVAEEKSAPVTLRGINVEIYKVLKLARLSSRFSFVN